MKNIVLLGYMGSGKTSVAQRLSAVLDRKFIDLDDVIEREENLNINEIFERKGALYFRKIEHQLLKEIISKSENTILSLGGGTPVYFNNMDVLLQNDRLVTVYLNASIQQLSDHLFEQRLSRPLISHVNTKEELTEFIAKHLFERRSDYLKAQYKINTEGKNIDQISREIIARLF